MNQINKPAKHSMALAWLICGLGIVFYSYEFLLRVAPSVMVPEIRAYFNISAAGFGILVGLYYVAYTPMQLFVGSVMDLYGPRRILTFAVLLCACGTLIFASSRLLWFGGVGRLLVGFGSAFAFVGALKLGSVWLPKNRFTTFTGIVTGVAMATAMVGDISLTAIVQHVDWQTLLTAAGVLGLLLAPIMWLIIRDRPDYKKTVTEATLIPYSVLFEGYWKILHNSQIWLSGFIACTLYLSLSGFAEIWGIPFLRDAYNFSPHEAAVANSMVFFGWMIGGPVVGLLADKFSSRRWLLLLGTLGAAVSIMLVLYVGHITVVSVSLLLFLFGLFASAEVICFTVGRENAPHYLSGTALAFVNMLTMLGGVVFQPLIGRLLDMAWSGNLENGIRVYTTHDFRIALTALPIAMLVSTGLTLLLRKPASLKSSHE